MHSNRQTREKYPKVRDKLDNVAKDYRHTHDSYKPRTETDTPETDSYDKTWQEAPGITVRCLNLRSNLLFDGA